MYLNFGAVGSTIGHEMTHEFDTYGAKYDENGTDIFYLDYRVDSIQSNKKV